MSGENGEDGEAGQEGNVAIRDLADLSVQGCAQGARTQLSRIDWHWVRFATLHNSQKVFGFNYSI